jgi:hypothetical protein
MRNHGEKLECGICFKKITGKSNLKRHLQRHVRGTKELSE